ncbi:MAG: hypothetical protein KME43_21355 [Myxacorys chilensis ATA2-1-KO14]|jgi:hypothetical protein|nr:hypothetical protein [Myxacorys chilensis ATA2-1-KO14]
MKRLFAVSVLLSVLVPSIAQPVKAIGCTDSVSYVVLSSGRCLVFAEGVARAEKTNNSPLVVSGLRLKRSADVKVMSIVGSLTNTSDKVYRLPTITIRIGENRLEEVILGGLIAPGQTRKFESLVEREKYSLKAPLSVESVEALDR